MDTKFTSELPKIQMPAGIQNSRNALVEIVLLIIVAVLFQWFIIGPKVGAVAAEQQQLDGLRKQASSTLGSLQTLKDLSSKLATNSADVKNLDEALPLEQRSVRLVMLLQNIAQSAGVVVTDVGVDGAGDSAGIPSLVSDPYSAQRSLQPTSLSLSVTGTMSQLVDLLKKLETYGRIMDISSLSLTPDKNSTLDMKLNMTTYYFVPAAK